MVGSLNRVWPLVWAIWRGLLGELEPWEHASRSLLTGKSSSSRGKQCLFPMLPAVLYLWRHDVPWYHGEGSDNTTETWFLLFGSPASWAGLAMWTHQPECFLGSVCLGLKATSALCSLQLCHTTVHMLFLPGNLGCWCIQDPSPDVLPASTPLCQSIYSNRK